MEEKNERESGSREIIREKFRAAIRLDRNSS